MATTLHLNKTEQRWSNELERERREGAALTRTKESIREIKCHFLIVSDSWFCSKAQIKMRKPPHSPAGRCRYAGFYPNSAEASSSP